MSQDSLNEQLNRTAGRAERSPNAYPATAWGGDQLAWTLPGEFERLPDPRGERQAQACRWFALWLEIAE
jgi:hypothetical protein